MEAEILTEYLRSLRERGLHADTLAEHGRGVRQYAEYLAAGGCSLLTADACAILAYYKAACQTEHAASTIWKKQHAVYAFYAWLADTGRMLLNPAPKPALNAAASLPRGVTGWSTLRDVYRRLRRSRRLWEQRDLAIIDLAYSCGLRRCELHRLDVDDITPEGGLREGGTVRVRGKGGRARVVPIGPRSLKDLLNYVYHVRPRFITRGRSAALFVTWQRGGDRMNIRSINAAFRRLRRKYGLGKGFAPHRLRHGFATDLLLRGAPVQDVSRMLGHAKLETTQLYTRLLPMDLKRQHERFHPRG